MNLPEPFTTPKRGARGVRLDQAIQAVLAAKVVANCRPTTIAALRRYLTNFARGRESAPVESITVELIEEWFARRGESKATQQSNQGRLSSLFAFAERRGWIDRNPCRQLEPIKVDWKPPFILAPHQAAMLLDYSRDRKPGQLAFWTLALMAGVRPDELARISWESVNLDEGVVVIDGAASKVRRRRIITLEPSAVTWMKLAKEKGGRLPVSRMTRRRYLVQACEVLGFDGWPHDCLRHTAASYLLAKHQDAGKVAYNLGNSARVLETHYKQLAAAKQCAEFWSITPESPRPEKPVDAPEQATEAARFDPNVPKFVRIEAALQMETELRSKAKQRQRAGSYHGGVTRSQLPGKPMNTIRELGRMSGCSRQTVRLCREIVRHAPQDILDALRNGRLSIAGAHRKLLAEAA